MSNPNAAVQSVPPLRETVRKEGAMGFTTRVYPKIYGGICERCGVLDPNRESMDQYKLCEHYRGLNLECNYCDATKDQREVTRISKLYVYDHPFQKDAVGRPQLAVVCDAFTCTSKFNAEFRK